MKTLKELQYNSTLARDSFSNAKFLIDLLRSGDMAAATMATSFLRAAH